MVLIHIIFFTFWYYFYQGTLLNRLEPEKNRKKTVIFKIITGQDQRKV
jgi:hypothetical protein